MRRRALLLAGGGVAVAAGAADAPARPIRLIVVYPTGGLSDGIARTLAETLAQRLGVPVFVENRPGGGGSVGLEALAKAEPDGTTLAFSAISPLTVRPHLTAVRYDPLRDFAPVASVMYTPVLLVGTPALRARSFRELLAEARERPGELRWASSGPGTAGHLVLEHVQLGTGLRFVHVPYKGGGQQLTDALGGQFELLSTNLAPAQLELVAAGRLLPLALGSPTRSQALPQVPTFAELGLPRANIVSLFGLFAPGRTPEAVLARLNAEINHALQAGELPARLRAADNIPTGGSRASFARQIAREWQDNKRLAGAGIRLE